MENDKMKIHIQITTDNGEIFSGDVLLQKTAKTKRPVVDASSKGKPLKCPDVISLLWQHGRFKQALQLAEIKKALDAAGYSFTDENILMALSRVKFLTKHGNRGAFTWKQKYPFE